MQDCRFCRQCARPLHPQQRKFCSKKCFGLNQRGSGKSYIRIRVNGARVYLHRHLVEKHIRPLEPGEIVHHRNGDKHDNRLENLEILSGQAAHLHAHNYFRGRQAETWQTAPIPADDHISEFAEFGF